MNKYKNRLIKMLDFEMTKDIKDKVIAVLNDDNATESDHEKVWQEFRGNRHITKNREELDWFPTIDHEKCTACRICLKTCPKSVYSEELVKRDTKRIIVNKPYSCVLLCSHCAGRCPENAISFPSRKDYQEFIKYY